MAPVRPQRYHDTRRNRVRRPPPKAGVSMADLARLSGVAAVTIKAYIRRGLLGRVKFYGSATRYPREHLVRLLAIRFLRGQGMRNLDEIRSKLDAWAPADMERWILEHPLVPATLAALGYPVAAARSADEALGASAKAHVSPLATVAKASNVLPVESWRRVMLMPGLELQVRTDAGAIVESVAERLVANFAELLTVRT